MDYQANVGNGSSSRRGTVGKKAAVFGITCFLLAPALPAFGDPVPGQSDNFEDGTTMGWRINLLGMGAPPSAALPTNVPTGGPGGANDNFLRLTALGGQGAGSRLTALNLDSRWAGNYLAAGVNFILADVNNQGNSDLALRVLFEDPGAGPPANVAVSAAPILLPTGGGWTRVAFPISPNSLTAEAGTVLGALTNATAIRIFHSPIPGANTPIFPGPPVVAQLGIDNFTAAAMPEPGAFPLLALGTLAGLAHVRIWRRLGRQSSPR
jgi:hypothetical protein